MSDYDYGLVSTGKLWNKHSRLHFFHTSNEGVIRQVDETDVDPRYISIAYGIARVERGPWKTQAERKAADRAKEFRERTRKAEIAKRFARYE